MKWIALLLLLTGCESDCWTFHGAALHRERGVMPMDEVIVFGTTESAMEFAKVHHMKLCGIPGAKP